MLVAIVALASCGKLPQLRNYLHGALQAGIDPDRLAGGPEDAGRLRRLSHRDLAPSTVIERGSRQVRGGAVTVGPVAVEPDFAERIARAAGPGVTVRDVAVMPGGHSGLTHRVSLDGLAGHERWSIKSTPPGRTPRGRHDVLRQARVVRALEPARDVPVPSCAFEDIDAAAVLRRRLRAGRGGRPGDRRGRVERSTPSWSRRAGAPPPRCSPTCTAWPSVDLRVTGAGDRRAARARSSSCGAQTMAAAPRWTSDPVFVRLRDAMLADVPAAERAALVHGDFRLGNMLFDGAVPRAVIDWEIWAVGDPLVDLGWFVQFTDGENFPGHRPARRRHADRLPGARSRTTRLTGEPARVDLLVHGPRVPEAGGDPGPQPSPSPRRALPRSRFRRCSDPASTATCAAGSRSSVS